MPITGPLLLSLNEAVRFGTKVITLARIIGISVVPAERNRWPKAKRRSPSTCVTVPDADTFMSPRIRPTLIIDPGPKRPPTSSAAVPPAPCKGRRPSRSNSSLKTSKTRSLNPASATGVAIGTNRPTDCSLFEA